MKKGQVTLFIILAIVIVGGVIAFFAIKSSQTTNISSDLRPAYDYYLSCLKDSATGGIRLMGEQGGYIEVPNFVPGSQYMPFSSQLDFFGQPIPYWMYVSGNNILREQVPTMPRMEDELSNYLTNRLEDCDFTEFSEMGYDVYVEGISTSTNIEDQNVDFNINSKITIFYQDQSAVVTNHKLTIDSKLGKFYKLAKEVYDYEKTNMFLENYAVDVMRLYAPVTGIELSCTPKIFVDEEISDELKEALAANIPAIKLDGSYYELSSKEQDYFVTPTNFNVDENVNFLYVPDWPTRVEIYGDKVVKPIGLEQGMGLLGFCYVPYHLVYDINFPVLVQFFDSEELFQFPLAVIIAKNMPRTALPTNAGESIESEVCKYKNQDVEIYTYDLNLNPVESRIQFKCLNSICDIGQTKATTGGALLEGEIPQCVNGFLLATAEGYADSKVQISSNEETIANMLMKKKHELALDLGSVQKALISFNSQDHSATVLYPDTDRIELIEAYYNVSVYVYSDTLLKFPAVNEKRCVDVPESGLSGFFGAETEKCFDINLPETDIDFAVVGGGSTQEYILETVLEDSRELNINVPLFKTPQNLEGLQQNYLAVEDEIVYLSFE